MLYLIPIFHYLKITNHLGAPLSTSSLVHDIRNIHYNAPKRAVNRYDKNHSEKSLILLKFLFFANNSTSPFATTYLMMQCLIHYFNNPLRLKNNHI
jgi:hypothetical protein